MGMAVQPRGRTVSSPSSMGDTGMGVENLGEVWFGLLDELLELSNLADLLESEHLVLLVAVDSYTSRVISTIL